MAEVEEAVAPVVVGAENSTPDAAAPREEEMAEKKGPVKRYTRPNAQVCAISRCCGCSAISDTNHACALHDSMLETFCIPLAFDQELKTKIDALEAQITASKAKIDSIRSDLEGRRRRTDDSESQGIRNQLQELRTQFQQVLVRD